MTTSTHEGSSAAAAGALPGCNTLAPQARRGTTWDMSDAERELRQIVDKLSPEALARLKLYGQALLRVAEGSAETMAGHERLRGEGGE